MDRRSTLRVALVLALGAVVRLGLASGYGLGDDHGYFQAYYKLYTSGALDTEQVYDFRFAFWIPVVASMHLLGPGEVGFIAFITLCSLANLVLVHRLGRQEWGEEGGLLAMALLAVFPLDVLCSTLFVIDVPLATWCFAAFWLYREAIRVDRRASTRWWLAAGSAVLLFVAYSTKQWAVLVGPLFAAEALAAPRRTLAPSLVTAGGFLALVGLYSAWQWARFGDPFYDVHLVRSVAAFLPHSRNLLLDYPRLLVQPNEYGSWFAGFYPHALALLALLFAHRARVAAKWLLYFLVLLAALAAAPSHRESGRWVVLSPHIFRYLCLLSIPLCLALAAYVRELRRVAPVAGTALTAGFLALSLWQSVELTAPTRDAFGEQRRAVRALRAFPDETAWLASDLGLRFANLEQDPSRLGRLVVLRSEDFESRARELAPIEEGIVMTGGAGLPWYGCHRCTTNLGPWTPPPTWTLTATWDEPLSGYRAEPLRIWRVSAVTTWAQALLAERSEPEARLALLREVAGSGDHRLAAAVGEQLLAENAAASEEVMSLTAAALLRAQRYHRAEEVLAARLALRPEGAALGETLAGLALAAAGRSDFDEARRWFAEHHRRLPDAPADPRRLEVESGLAEAITRYHQVRYREAAALCRGLVAHPDPGVQRRARYFLALSLFRLTRLAEALDETARYRSTYGEDELWTELYFRHAEAVRRRDPATARTIFTDLMARFPTRVWAGEARRLLERMRGP